MYVYQCRNLIYGVFQMASSKPIGPSEWLCSIFSPHVCVVASPPAERLLAESNNLTAVELLQPFSRLDQDVSVKDPNNANNDNEKSNIKTVSNFGVNFTDFKKDPNRLVTAKLLQD